ncbi:protein trachealess-like isoform X3 [Varroa jacobsoni]|uniref:protein trachealess-like isoform X3 n=1 Tax=Varroa jacobsoni TaxID=62625 RepID=UPI000BFA0749|nr:protein trachealess-like isoform X3 [Varroa jacobsoni]
MLTGVPHRQSVDCMSSVPSLVPLATYQPQQYQTPTPNQNWSVPNCILEMRKEKSRDAARSRRGKENFEFYELAKLLPLPAAITSQLDKASIIRLTISYLKLRDFSHHADLPWVSSLHSPSHTHHDKLHLLKSSPLRPSRSVATEVFEQHQGTHILQSLDGFAFVLAADGRFLYISETVSIYLGLSQVEMTGSTIFDYVHQHDHAEVSEQLGLSAGNVGHSPPPPPPSSTANSDDGSCDRPAATMQAGSHTAYAGLERSFCVRMKSTLTKRGCHFKSSGYRVVLVLCHLRPQSIYTSSAPSLGGAQLKGQPVLGLVGLAVALPPPSVNEVRLGCDMFVTRVNLDFRVSHCEPRVQQLLDYNADDLTGRSLYSLVHAQDVQRLRQLHMDIMHKGQAMSGYYRLMNKSGGFSWIQTCATVICASKQSSQEEQSIICVNYVISAGEFDSIVMDASQLPGYREPSPLKRDCGSPPVSPLPKPHHTLASGVGTSATLTMHQSNTADPLPLSTLPISGVSKLEPVKDVSCDPVSSPLTYEVLDDPKARKKYNGGHSGGSGKNRKRPAVSDSPEDGEMKEKKEISELSRPWKSGASDNSNVKDLEDAMKKHLPPPPLPSQTSLDANNRLMPQPPTIQWIGAPAPSTPPSATSSLLRQLYVNRETVIRQSNQPAAGNGRSPYTPYGDVAPADAYHHHSHGDFMLHHNPAGLGAPYNGYEAYPQGRDNLVPGMMTPVATLPSMTSMTSMTSMQRHVPYELPLRPQVLVHPSLDYAPPPPIHNEPQLYHHLSGGNPWYPQPN